MLLDYRYLCWSYLWASLDRLESLNYGEPSLSLKVNLLIHLTFTNILLLHLQFKTCEHLIALLLMSVSMALAYLDKARLCLVRSKRIFVVVKIMLFHHYCKMIFKFLFNKPMSLALCIFLMLINVWIVCKELVTFVQQLFIQLYKFLWPTGIGVAQMIAGLYQASYFPTLITVYLNFVSFVKLLV